MFGLRNIAVSILACSALSAAGVFNFEPPTYAGTPGGTSIAGQNGWTTPTGNAFVYTYAGNAPGFSAAPAGGTQFLGASSSNPSPGSTPPASRARQALDLSAGTLWNMTFDVAALNGGVTDNTGIFNFGSIPILDSSANGIMMSQVLIWDSSSAGSTFSFEDIGYDVAGNPNFIITPGNPGSAFTGLSQNTWYRVSVVFDLNLNKIVTESIRDLTHNGATNTYAINPSFFLDGGAANPQTATQFGLTTVANGVNSSTNSIGLDNVSFVSTGAAPEPATWSMLALTLATACVARTIRPKRR